MRRVRVYRDYANASEDFSEHDETLAVMLKERDGATVSPPRQVLIANCKKGDLVCFRNMLMCEVIIDKIEVVRGA